MRPAHIKLHIEELVLQGFAPGDRYAISEAVERELSRLLTEHSAERSSSSSWRSNTECLDAGAFRVDPRSRPHAIGTKIARAIHGGLDMRSVGESGSGKK